MKSFLDRQVELRNQTWEKAKVIIDLAEAENRDLSGEEQASYDKHNAELNERAEVITKMREDEARELRFDAATREIADQVRPVNGGAPASETDETAIRSLMDGSKRSHVFEQRDITKAATGAPVPTSFYDKVIMKARLVAPMLETSTVLNTAGGENLQIPRHNTWSTAIVNAEGQAITENDPTFSSFITLGAFKYSFIVQVSTELIEDSGVDFLSFIAAQTGNALGFDVGAALTVGTGTTQPLGIVSAAGSGVTGGTPSANGATADNLIDLFYTLNGAYRLMPSVGWMMNGKSIGQVRKLKTSTGGDYIFQPALSLGAPDTLLGKRLIENPSMVDATTSALSIIVGDLEQYYVRTVGGIRLDRSDDFAFNAGLVTFRASYRVDGNLPQPGGVLFYKGGTA